MDSGPASADVSADARACPSAGASALSPQVPVLWLCLLLYPAPRAALRSSSVAYCESAGHLRAVQSQQWVEAGGSGAPAGHGRIQLEPCEAVNLCHLWTRRLQPPRTSQMCCLHMPPAIAHPWRLHVVLRCTASLLRSEEASHGVLTACPTLKFSCSSLALLQEQKVCTIFSAPNYCYRCGELRYQ